MPTHRDHNSLTPRALTQRREAELLLATVPRKRCLRVRIAVLGVGFLIVVALGCGKSTPEPLPPSGSASEPTPATAQQGVPTTFGPADVIQAKTELIRRGVGKVLLASTHPTGAFISTSDPVLSTSADGRLQGQVTVKW